MISILIFFILSLSLSLHFFDSLNNFIGFYYKLNDKYNLYVLGLEDILKSDWRLKLSDANIKISVDTWFLLKTKVTFQRIKWRNNPQY